MISVMSAVDVAEFAFYGLASAAIVLGALIATRRFAIERPHSESWRIEVDDGRCREVRLREGATRYVHSVQITLTNNSFAPQKLAGFWYRLITPDDEDFLGRRFDEASTSMEGLREFFGRKPLSTGTVTPPNGVVRFGPMLISSQPYTALRLFYTVLGFKPRLLLPGFHVETRDVAVGTVLVPSNTDDLRLIYDQAHR
jgi:hypothetical protein